MVLKDDVVEVLILVVDDAVLLVYMVVEGIWCVVEDVVIVILVLTVVGTVE